ncbi:2'-5' RNA ligase family protein [Paenibacillus sp. NEAU-GSW1]|uniref:2'-5' RNA ligase family protein n=1 Tax=Paenibacillus sp. NEAU-GSW1 TaxID=2682486 RepID=UPI0012E0CDF0|nr:2'-5' RNA ligase family protein [Paenibacillus sp. NEAU-GSW1]MUT66154.1 phosphoesterase [Paenibacillus sp. NEAU-GSW1]
MQFGIAAFPSKEVQDFANGWRIRHDPRYSAIPPHLTVRDKSELSEEQLQETVAHLDKVTATLTPFTIRFNRVSTFYPVNNVLYLALEDPLPFKHLHQLICNGPLAIQKQNYVYTPHVTIGQQMNADELHDLYGNLRMSKVDLTTKIDRIHLLHATENGFWTAYQSFLFRA